MTQTRVLTCSQPTTLCNKVLVPPKRKKSASVQTPNSHLTAMISSRGLSQAQLLTEGDVSKIIVSRPAWPASSPPSSKKSRVSHDLTPTVGVSSTSFLQQPQTQDQSDCQNETTVIWDIDQDIYTGRDKRAADTTDAVANVKKEPDRCYEALLAPAIIKPGYDAHNDVEIIKVLGVGSTSSSQSNLTTSKNKGAWGNHILACHTKTKETKKKKKQQRKHFTCFWCQVTFANRSILIRHKEGCKWSGNLQCNSCSKTFVKKGTLG